jgi:hypothetical protein
MQSIRSFVPTIRIPFAIHSCSNCQSQDFRRSARRGYTERMLGLIVLPYRCNWCSFRFFRPRGADTHRISLHRALLWLRRRQA